MHLLYLEQLRLPMLGVLAPLSLNAQVTPLTPDQARDAALQHPAVLTLRSAYDASRRLDQPYFPNLNGHITGALANPNARLAAGQMTNPFVISRFGAGITFNQLLWDFGRGLHQRASQRHASEAALEETRQMEAEAILAVEQAFWRLWE